MGLFDGAADNRGSTADLAAALGLPVILVLDADRQSQSIAALAHGFATWRPDVQVAGLIVNRVASHPPRGDAAQRTVGARHSAPRRVAEARHADPARPPPRPRPARRSRTLRRRRQRRRRRRWRTFSTSTCCWPCPSLHPALPAAERVTVPVKGLPPLGQHIAIARDAAFAFLYPHWLRDWHAAGATAQLLLAARRRSRPTRRPTPCSCPAAIPNCTAKPLRR